jgi:hypothetical protein
MFSHENRARLSVTLRTRPGDLHRNTSLSNTLERHASARVQG